MPLHLLGKKSWNVYNAENIARVQRDEAAARAREEAHEQRMHEHDAKVRLALLRGETPPPPLPEEEDDEQIDQSTNRNAPSSSRRDTGAGGRKRKRAGEDDTEFEMRLARERAELGDRVAGELGGVSKRKSSSSREITLVDSAGHISLFEPPSEDRRKKEKNPEYEREAVQKKLEQEDQYRMRLVNAAGKNGLGLTDGGPWYAAPDGDSTSALVAPSKDVFGRDDPGRKAREVARLDASDPLALMKMGAAKVRQLNKERQRIKDEREEELRALRKEEWRREKEKERMRRREKEERSRKRDDRDDRERPHRDDAGRDGHSRSHRRSRSRHRSRSRERNRGKSRERSRERRRSRDRDLERRHRDHDDDRHSRRHSDHHRSQMAEEDRHRHKRRERDRDNNRR